jgi:hypothetical protein
MARLPVVNGDNERWGDILNDYLLIAHDDGGNLRAAATIAGAEQTSRKGMANGYAPLNSGGKIPSMYLPTAQSTQEVFEVYLQLNYTADPSSYDASGLSDGNHVLFTWANNWDERGIYVVQDGSLVLATAVFDGTHDGCVIWVYGRIEEEGGSSTGPYLYGVYTTEFCSLVELSAPNQLLEASQSIYDNSVGRLPDLDPSPNLQAVIDNLASNPRTAQRTLSVASEDYFITGSDAEGVIETNSSTPLSVIIPLNSTVPFPIGTEIEICQMGAGQTLVTGEEGVTVYIPSGYTLNIGGQYGTARIRKRTDDEWVLSGNLAVYQPS